MKKILIALDYDISAQKVAELGYSLAKTLKAETILLHVIADPKFYSSKEYSPIIGFTGYMEMEPNQLDSIEGLKKATNFFLSKIKKHLDNDDIQLLVKEGDIADTILNVAKELHVKIIAMGSHSHKWLENIVMGSVTEKVLNNTSIPLFIIPIKEKI